jgi:hypothetical protein
MVLADASCGGFNNPLAGIPVNTYLKRLKAGERPVLPAPDGTGLGMLINFCWKYEADGRPTAEQVRVRLNQMWNCV